MVNFSYKSSYDFRDLVALMRILREHCPWDREQTHASIRQNLLEEAYEVCEGIDGDDPRFCARSWATCCCRWCSTCA